MDISKENSPIYITDLRNAEKKMSIKETYNQYNNQTPHNVDYAIISVSQEHQFNCKRSAPESKCPSSPLSPKFTLFIMKTNTRKPTSQK